MHIPSNISDLTADKSDIFTIEPSADYKSLHKEQIITYTGLIITCVALVLFSRDIWLALSGETDTKLWFQTILFTGLVLFLIYGNIGYQLTRLAHIARLANHHPSDDSELSEVFDQMAPPLSIIVPSYKEEPEIVRQTLLSGALQTYPNRKITLLIDDPLPNGNYEAQIALDTMRNLVHTLDQQLTLAAEPFIAAQQAFSQRRTFTETDQRQEAANISALYQEAANVLESFAQATPQRDHTDKFFSQAILLGPAEQHKESSRHWKDVSVSDEYLDAVQIAKEYSRLAALFNTEITSFERKQYANLSHEPNKAMNLNSYIGLLGQYMLEVEENGKKLLINTPPNEATLAISEPAYLITLDADSLILPDYALRLIHHMETPGNERIAVIQTPYSAIPDPTSHLERTAGATTDIQYLIHQGFTGHRATFWVGANAVLRYRALHDIVEEDQERGYTIKRYIQDRTVIEDTESTVDLIDKGWALYNYPERLAYSATPPDFGALTIQRGRWANGGLIILPKLLRYMLNGPGRLKKLRECFFRIHYLTSIAGVNIGLLVMLTVYFPKQLESWWLPVTAVPYYALYTRDLWSVGYRKTSDIIRIYVLNLLLLPVNLGGVIRSIHQALSRKKIPFLRTPKIDGRTRVPPRYIFALLAITTLCLINGILNVIDKLWVQAFFSFLHAGAFAYGLILFIGAQNAWSDLLAGWHSAKAGQKVISSPIQP